MGQTGYVENCGVQEIGGLCHADSLETYLAAALKKGMRSPCIILCLADVTDWGTNYKKWLGEHKFYADAFMAFVTEHKLGAVIRSEFVKNPVHPPHSSTVVVWNPDYTQLNKLIAQWTKEGKVSKTTERY
jgi:hypothetical protein